MISRREVLSWLGVSAGACAVSAGSPLSAAPVKGRSERDPRVLNLESFSVTKVEHSARLHAYLRDTLLPRMEQIHRGPRLYLDAIVAPHTPQAALLAVFSSFEEMLDIRASLGSNPPIRHARADLESARVLEAVQSQVLVVSQKSLHLPADLESFEKGVLEVRSYDAPAWHAGPPSSVSDVFRRAGMDPIVSAATAAGEHMPRFTYVIPFESLAAREQAWTALDADPEWMAMQRESANKYGAAVTATSKSIYKLAPYCRLG